MFSVGDKIKTRCGPPSESHWEHGTITVTHITEDGDVMYKVNWEGGGCDYLYDFEMELVPENGTENECYYEVPPKSMYELILEEMKENNPDVIDFD